jgi:hypothetical protein
MLNERTGKRELLVRPQAKTDPVKQLAATVLITAYKDLAGKDGPEKQTAIYFFENGRYEFWCHMAGILPEIALEGYVNVRMNGLDRSEIRRLYEQEKRRQTMMASDDDE